MNVLPLESFQTCEPDIFMVYRLAIEARADVRACVARVRASLGLVPREPEVKKTPAYTLVVWASIGQLYTLAYLDGVLIRSIREGHAWATPSPVQAVAKRRGLA